jgi:hypothetical protein
MKTKKKVLLLVCVFIGVVILAAAYIAYINSPLGIIAIGNPNAGTWYDDPKNWNRAFGEDLPKDLSMVHSYYWASDHFTHEYIYFFEVKASNQWLEAFLKESEVVQVSSEKARRFEVHYDGTPDWFVPEPVGNYDVWDKIGYYGSIWVKKSNGHIYFYGVQL